MMVQVIQQADKADQAMRAVLEDENGTINRMIDKG